MIKAHFEKNNLIIDISWLEKKYKENGKKITFTLYYGTEYNWEDCEDNYTIQAQKEIKYLWQDKIVLELDNLKDWYRGNAIFIWYYLEINLWKKLLLFKDSKEIDITWREKNLFYAKKLKNDLEYEKKDIFILKDTLLNLDTIQRFLMLVLILLVFLIFFLVSKIPNGEIQMFLIFTFIILCCVQIFKIEIDWENMFKKNIHYNKYVKKGKKSGLLESIRKIKEENDLLENNSKWWGSIKIKLKTKEELNEIFKKLITKIINILPSTDLFKWKLSNDISDWDSFKNIIKWTIEKDIENLEIQIFASNSEKWNYEKNSGSSTSITWFNSTVGSVLLFSKKLNNISKWTQIQELIKWNIDFSKIYSNLFPPIIITQKMWLFLNLEVKIKSKKYIDTVLKKEIFLYKEEFINFYEQKYNINKSNLNSDFFS